MTEVIRNLEDSRNEFIAAAKSIPAAHTNVPPEPGRWSAEQCVEHVTTVEERFMGWLQQGQGPDVPPADPHKEAELAARVRSRATRIEAPEAVRPTGRFTSMAQALEHFNATRDRSVQFARERGPALYSLAGTHPRLGPLNGVEFMTIIAAHSLRHAEQIREIQAGLAASASR